MESLYCRSRCWLRRGAAIPGLVDDAMGMVCERLNSTPRKHLRRRTLAEAFRAEMRRVT